MLLSGLLPFVVSAAPVWGQVTTPYAAPRYGAPQCAAPQYGAPALYASGTQHTAPAQFTAPAQLAPEAPIEAPSGYWIISSRCCPTDCTACRHCEFQVWYFDACGRGRPATLDAWAASFVPGVPACIMTHGSFVEWPSVCDDSRGTHRWLREALCGRPLHLTFFTWPSDDPAPVLPQTDVWILGKRASGQSFYLARLVRYVPEASPLVLMGHSHGARITFAAMHLLGGGDIFDQTLPPDQLTSHRIRVVVAAAAIDHCWLNPGRRFGLAAHRAECIVNLRNRHDLPLLLYPLRHPFSGKALGQAGLTRRDERRLGEQAAIIHELDVTDIVRRNHYWPYYYREPTIAAALAPVFDFTSVAP